MLPGPLTQFMSIVLLKVKHYVKPGLFLFIFVFSNKHYNFYNKYMWKLSIHYKVLEFESSTFKSWVSSHNHKAGLN